MRPSSGLRVLGIEHHAGLAGLSGTDGDMRDVLVRRAAGDLDAALGFDVYVHRLVASYGTNGDDHKPPTTRIDIRQASNRRRSRRVEWWK